MRYSQSTLAFKKRVRDRSIYHCFTTILKSWQAHIINFLIRDQSYSLGVILRVSLYYKWPMSATEEVSQPVFACKRLEP